MAIFRLLAGQHQQADPDWKPPEDAKRRGDGRYVYKSGPSKDGLYIDPDTSRPLRAPTRTYKINDLVPSDTDLVAKFGANKFLKVGETPAAFTPGEAALANPGVFPHGQVSTGFQRAGGGSPTPEAPGLTPQSAVGGTGATAGAITDPEEVAAAGGIVPGEGGGDEDGEDGAATGGPSNAELDEMTVAELKQYAADEEIDISGATHKAEILNKVKRARRR